MRTRTSQASTAVTTTSSRRTSARTSITTATTTPTTPVSDLGDFGHAAQVNNPSSSDDQRFHSLPLRRRGNILKTAAGFVVKKTRLSALFRKDAVPILNQSTSTSTPATPRVDARQLLDDQEEEDRQKREEKERKKRRRFGVMPTIPDHDAPRHLQAAAYPGPQHASSSSPVPSPSRASNQSFTTPTPPSFLSPFWYRPEEYDKISARSGPSSVRTGVRPLAHGHTMSEPTVQLRYDYHDSMAMGRNRKTWRGRMGGLFRQSYSAVR